MNTNKQLTKGNTMKKIAMVIGLLSVLATSANATTYWTHKYIWWTFLQLEEVILALTLLLIMHYWVDGTKLQLI
jgi:hypothetical protein